MTRWLARITSGFVFVNLGATLGKYILVHSVFLAHFYLVIIITLLATTARSEMHTASYVFGSEGFINQTGGWNDGLAFLFGLLSVQWTVSTIDISVPSALPIS